MTFALAYGITNYKKRSVIAAALAAERVSIVGAFYGGQDYEADLESDLDAQGHHPPGHITRYCCTSQ
jgi:hypothetical protein